MHGERLSIALLTTSLSRFAGGVVVPIRTLAERLSHHGFDVRAYGIHDAACDVDSALWNGTPIHAARATFSAGIEFAPGIDKALEAARHDLLHQHGLWLYPSLAANAWRTREQRPVVISPHGMLDPWALRNSRWKKRVALALYERRNLTGASCMHALNEAEARAIFAMKLGNPVAIIPNGVALPPDSADYSRPSFLAADDRRVLLFLGRFHPKKGVLETIEAWSHVVRRAPAIARDWTLVLAGWDDGGHAEAASRLVSDLGLQAHVHLPGPLFGVDKESALACADAFILASHSEGLPMAVLEAWAHRTPVFMTRACNLPEGFDAGAAIELCTDPSMLADTLSAHLSRGDLATMGEAGRALVEARFGWDRIALQFIDVYRWLCQGAAKPACILDA